MRYTPFFQGVLGLAILVYMPALSAATCEYVVTSEWDTGFTSRVTVKNDTLNVINGWQVHWTFADGGSVSQIWNASLDGSGPYSASDLGHNGTILPNAKVEFGFNGNKPNAGPHQTPKLGGICSDVHFSYVLDASKSSLFFVTTKKTHVVETHSFGDLAGSIAADGEAIVTIGLDSVKTNINIRDERMRNLLFETDTFALARASLRVDMIELQALSVGFSRKLVSAISLDLHGVEQTVPVEVMIHRLTTETLLVQTAAPILIQASDFGLDTGVEALRAISNLDVISYAVPVNFTLFFNAQ